MEQRNPIRTQRRAVEMSQRELALASGIGLRTLIRYEHGERYPTTDVLVRLADAIGCDAAELIPDTAKAA